MTPPGAGGRALALALLGRAAAALADPPRGALPPTPWTTVDPFPLAGSGVTAPTRLPDGRVAVFTRGPSTLALVDAERGTVRSSPVEEPPSDRFEPRIDARGRLVILGAEGTLFRLGLDGRVRVAAQLSGELLEVVERPDGTSVAAVSSHQHVDLVTLRADGSVATARPLHASPMTRPAALGEGRVALGIPRGLAVLHPSGTIGLVPSVEGLHHLVGVGGATLAVTDAAVFPLDDRGVAAPPRPLPAPTRWWTSAGDTALAWVDGPPPALLLVDRTGAWRRVAAPPYAESAMLDDAGAILLASRRGRLTALEPDGAERWVVDLRRTIVPRVTLGLRGDAWVTATDGSVLRLSSPPPSSQEAPRANR